MATASNAVLAGDREILMTRVFRAPRELVWRAWTDPEHLGQWWGPRGFATHTQHMEVRPGGRWRYVMRGPDGREYHNQVTYLEVTPPERIRFQHGGGEATEPVSHDMLATFEASGRNGLSTLVTLRMTFATPEARDHAVHMYGALEGGHQTFERLAEYLSDAAPSQQANDHLLRYRRVLNAPLALVWSAWTEPEQLKRWYGPAGGTISECTMELRPGGLFHYGLRTPDHAQMWGRWQFREIVPQARLVFVAACSDAARGVTRQPDKADWPLQMLASVSFAEHAGIGRGTLVDTEWQPLEPSPAERAAFAAGHGTMEQCCSRTFDQLQGYLAGRARPA